MKKFEFNYEGIHKVLEMKKLNIFCAPANSGKSKFAVYLEKGFSGTDKEFYCDNQKVSKNDYTVKFVTRNSDINEDLKLTSKSNVTKLIKNILSEHFDSELTCKILANLNNALLPIQSELQEQFSFFTGDFSEQAQVKLLIEDLFDVVKFCAVFVDTEKTQSSISKLMYLKMLLHLSHKEPLVIIIDDFDNDYDLNQMLAFTNWVDAIEDDVYVFIITKSSSFIRNVQNLYTVYSLNHNFLEFNKIIDNLLEKQMVNEIKDNYLGMSLISEMELISAKKSLKSILSMEISELVCMNNAELYFKFLRKNEIYDSKLIDYLQKSQKLI